MRLRRVGNPGAPTEKCS